MSLRRPTLAASSAGRLDHVLKVGMEEIGAPTFIVKPVKHWMDLPNNSQQLTDVLMEDLERWRLRQLNPYTMEDLERWRLRQLNPFLKHLSVPADNISITLKTRLGLEAEIEISSNLQITVTVSGQDYKEQTNRSRNLSRKLRLREIPSTRISCA
eukprot:4583101-Prymnesium_polylepis.1